eukprot:SAG22_NODE_17049_length_312_cov_1.014085_1_plen_61_part_01
MLSPLGNCPGERRTAENGGALNKHDFVEHIIINFGLVCAEQPVRAPAIAAYKLTELAKTVG